MIIVLLLLVLLALLVFQPSPLERFGLHDKPGSWTEELIKSSDPNAEELWRLSQSYMINAWECGSRIPTVPLGSMVMTRDCCAVKSTCR